MPKSKESFPNIPSEEAPQRHVENSSAVSSERERIEATAELQEDAERVERLKRKVRKTPRKQTTERPEVLAARIEEYQRKYLPDYLRGKQGLISRKITEWWTGRSGKLEIEGTENIPEDGPFLVIGNHFGGGDVEALLETFKDANVHMGAAKEMWWNGSFRWLMKRFGMIPIEESLANLTEAEKEEALKRQGSHGKKVFREIIDREKNHGAATNTEFIHAAVALLSRGDAVAVYPEGLWLNPEGVGKLTRERKELKQGYRGIELVASQYQKLTGKELPIVPTAYEEDAKTQLRKLTVGEPLKLSENESDLNGTDWCMTRVAEMLPEGQRGYYRSNPRK